MSLLAVGSIIEAVGKVAGDLITTDKEKMEMEIEQRKLDLEEKKLDMAGDMAQIEVNKAEAQSSSFFVSGWRPFIGWVCGAAVAWNWIGLKMLVFFAAYFGHPIPALAPADLGEMMPVLMGMLGLGGLRTIEKINGVSK